MSYAKKLAAVASCAAASFLFVATAAAQDGPERTGLYASGGASFHKFEGDNGIETDSSAFTARAGLQFNSFLALEADASFGIDDGDFDFSGNEDDFDLDDNSDGDVADVINAPGEFGLNYLLGAYLKASIPVGEQFELYARGGYAHADVETTIATPGGNTIELGDSESGGSYGVGASYYFTDNQAIRLDYTYTDFDLAEDNAIGVNYQFKF